MCLQNKPQATQELLRLIKEKASEVKSHGKTKTVRRRHGTQAGGWSLGGPHRSGAQGQRRLRYVYTDTQKELTARLRKCITAYQGVDLTEQSRLALWINGW